MIVKNLVRKIWQEERYFLLFIFIFALLLRIVYIFTIHHLPLFDSPTMDAGFHDEWAKQIAQGDFIGYGAYIRSPLYSHLLGLLYLVFGVSYYIVRIFFAILGSTSIVLIFKLAQYLFNKTAAVLASLVAALSWTFIYYDGELLDTSTALLISLLCVFVFVKVFASPTKKGYFLCGLMFGLGALTRDNFLPLIAIIFIWLIYYYRFKIKQAVSVASLFLCGAVLVISPVTIRNATVLKDFIPISYYTGVNFYLGNNPYADGRTAIVPGTRADWWGGVSDVHRIAESQMQRKLKPSEISLFWAKKAVDYIRSDIIHFCWFTLKKFFFIFDLNETSNNQNIYFFRNQSKMLRLPIFFSAWFYIPLGFLGMFFAIKDKKINVLPVFVFLLAYCVPLSFFFVFTRLRQPLMSLFVIFSGYALVRLYELFNTHKRNFINALGVYTVLFVALAFNSSGRVSLRDGHFTLGNAYMRKLDFKRAREEFNKAFGLGEPYRCRIFFQLGSLEFKEKKYSAAADYLIRTLQSDEKLTARVDEFLTQSLFIPPLFPIKFIRPQEKDDFRPLAEVFFSMGNRYASWQEYEAAEIAYKKSLTLKEDAKTNLNLGNVLSITKSEDALLYYRRAIELDEKFLPAYFNLSKELKKQNKLKEALSLLRKAINFTNNPKENAMINQEIREIEGLIKN